MTTQTERNPIGLVKMAVVRDGLLSVMFSHLVLIIYRHFS